MCEQLLDHGRSFVPGRNHFRPCVKRKCTPARLAGAVHDEDRPSCRAFPRDRRSAARSGPDVAGKHCAPGGVARVATVSTGSKAADGVGGASVLAQRHVHVVPDRGTRTATPSGSVHVAPIPRRPPGAGSRVGHLSQGANDASIIDARFVILDLSGGVRQIGARCVVRYRPRGARRIELVREQHRTRSRASSTVKSRFEPAIGSEALHKRRQPRHGRLHVHTGHGSPAACAARSPRPRRRDRPRVAGRSGCSAESTSKPQRTLRLGQAGPRSRSRADRPPVFRKQALRDALDGNRRRAAPRPRRSRPHDRSGTKRWQAARAQS